MLWIHDVVIQVVVQLNFAIDFITYIVVHCLWLAMSFNFSALLAVNVCLFTMVLVG